MKLLRESNRDFAAFVSNKPFDILLKYYPLT